MDVDGEFSNKISYSFGNISSEKYRAYVDVEVTPSFQF